MSKKQFPKQLFVYIENKGTDDEFLMACNTENECADMNHVQLVGVYELKETRKVAVNVVSILAK